MRPRQLFTRGRVAFYTFIAFGPGTMTGLYLHSLKLEMENDNRAAKLIAMMKAQEEVLEEERKEAAILTQMQKVQANLQLLHSRMRALEETVTGHSTIDPLADILPTSTDTLDGDDASNDNSDQHDDTSLVATIQAAARQWWEDEHMQEKVDAWYAYLWEDDELDEFFSLDAWKAKALAWWSGEESSKPPSLHASALLQTVEQWATIDGTLSWLQNKDVIRAKLQETVAQGREAREVALAKEVAAKKEAEIKRQRKVLSKLERMKDQSGIEARTSGANATRIQKDFEVLKKHD
ncbi:hypothetical protein DYB36_001473 [Aphanomyces astaci]|uniref:Uncharacterized protein n=2 Tax=Aphanomyces astaci TaxID=112090 RepID=A0A397BST4_APHAT|nr:hypothetical protein DYB36_001473 [Aphanomyces astaci]